MIIRGLFFIADGGYYVVDIGLVERVVRNVPVTPVPAVSEEVVGIINQRGRVVTVICIAVLLQIGRYKKGSTLNAVILKDFSGQNEQIGFKMQKPGYLLDIDDELIEPATADKDLTVIDHISGVVSIEGKYYRILDIASIINSYKV